MYYWANDASNVTATNGTSSANIESDFKDLMQELTSEDVPMIRPVWIMNPRQRDHLWILRESNGNLVFPEIKQNPPMLFGYPVLLTTNIPTNLGGGSNETEIYFADMS